jgi:hypothetical protein
MRTQPLMTVAECDEHDRLFALLCAQAATDRANGVGELGE